MGCLNLIIYNLVDGFQEERRVLLRRHDRNFQLCYWPPNEALESCHDRRTRP